ncbi:hypothetical protein [Sphaerisporangium perillae]|uniref:hypothetical protein n=1 Tax=Sphaerisporangium perillae TaxID=2935860 RepID=UPI00200C5D04|nr:hypothetical protein [Sphaerisporangium perillae]
MSRRKYANEFGLILVCTPHKFGRQREIEMVSPDDLEGCHIYVVSQQPRLSIDSDSVVFTKSKFSATLRVQRADKFDEYRISRPSSPEQAGFSYRSEWPYDFMQILDDRGELFFTAPVALFIREYKVSGLPVSLYEQEVLYVGQAFGKDGERTAFDRLRSHSTLQRIYSELPPDKEIWLSLCRITDAALSGTMTPHLLAEIEDDEENATRTVDMLRWAEDRDFLSREGIALTEAALIRFFQPKYNKIFRDNFPDPQHVSTRECYDLEINTLAMEFHGYAVTTQYWSSVVHPKWTHFEVYSLFSENDRRNMFDLWAD